MGTWGWMGSQPLMVGLLPPLLLVILLATSERAHAQDKNAESAKSKDTLFGDKCNATSECSFEHAVCDKIKGCQCEPDFPVTNHLNKCGKKVKVNETCMFKEQCEAETEMTDCLGNVCVCKFEMWANTKPDGTQECISVKNETKPEKYVDPAMIGILVAMFLMFITICVVLRLFSKARWRENRTIFNTPNPRLMNVSLLRDSKLLHERRGSRGSVRGPSRQPSMASLRPHSPNSPGSRRGSHGSSNASGTTSNKSPPASARHAHADAHGRDSSVTTPMLESVTVEIQK